MRELCDDICEKKSCSHKNQCQPAPICPVIQAYDKPSAEVELVKTQIVPFQNTDNLSCISSIKLTNNMFQIADCGIYRVNYSVEANGIDPFDLAEVRVLIATNNDSIKEIRASIATYLQELQELEAQNATRLASIAQSVQLFARIPKCRTPTCGQHFSVEQLVSQPILSDGWEPLPESHKYIFGNGQINGTYELEIKKPGTIIGLFNDGNTTIKLDVADAAPATFINITKALPCDK